MRVTRYLKRCSWTQIVVNPVNCRNSKCALCLMSSGLFLSQFDENPSQEGTKPVFRRKSLWGLGWSTCVNPFRHYYRCKRAIFRDSPRHSSRVPQLYIAPQLYIVPRLYIVPLPLSGTVKRPQRAFPRAERTEEAPRRGIFSVKAVSETAASDSAKTIAFLLDIRR